MWILNFKEKFGLFFLLQTISKCKQNEIKDSELALVYI